MGVWVSGRGFRLVLVAAATIAASTGVSAKDEIPDYMEIVVDTGKGATQSEIAANNVLALDTGMNQIYADTLAKYTSHMRARIPVILGMFSNTGGTMILLPPGADPIEAPPVPPVYAWVKSVSHSTMAVYQLVAPYLLNPGDTSWRMPMMAYLAKMKAAGDTLPNLDVDDDVRTRLRGMLDKNIAFLEKCLSSGTFNLKDLEEYAHSVEPDIVKNVALAASTQVGHWEGVLAGWKKRLGSDWDNTYAISNTLYVTRQNNILFTILAQEMGKEAIGDRLILVGTTEFTTTQEKLLDVLVRTVADRAIGKVFFRNQWVMDAELLGGAARDAIKKDAAAKAQKPLLPKLAPFHQHAWPWPTDPDSGDGPAEMKQIPGD